MVRIALRALSRVLRGQGRAEASVRVRRAARAAVHSSRLVRADLVGGSELSMDSSSRTPIECSFWKWSINACEHHTDKGPTRDEGIRTKVFGRAHGLQGRNLTHPERESKMSSMINTCVSAARPPRAALRLREETGDSEEHAQSTGTRVRCLGVSRGLQHGGAHHLAPETAQNALP